MRITKQVFKSYIKNYFSEFNIFLLLGIMMIPFFVLALLFSLWLDLQEKYKLYR